MPFTVDELAREIDLEVVGDRKSELTHVADLERSGQGALSFAVSGQYIKKLQTTGATAVILSRELLQYCKVTALVSNNPYHSFAQAAQLIHPQEDFSPGIHPSAVVDAACDIPEDVYIGPNVVIDAKCTMGHHVYIGPNSVITAPCNIGSYSRLLASVTLAGPVVMGERTLVHPGVVLGSDGFGFANGNNIWEKIPQLGKVIIGNDVEIGANTTIDRGALQDTIIEDGVKLDNQIQIAHNVKIGANTAIAGCAGIAGSAIIGKNCAIGGGAGVQGHIEIGDGITVTGMTKISQSISTPGSYTSGTAAQNNKQWIRNAMRFKDLDKLAQRIKSLEKKISDDNK